MCQQTIDLYSDNAQQILRPNCTAEPPNCVVIAVVVVVAAAAARFWILCNLYRLYSFTRIFRKMWTAEQCGVTVRQWRMLFIIDRHLHLVSITAALNTITTIMSVVRSPFPQAALESVVHSALQVVTQPTACAIKNFRTETACCR